MKRTTIWSLRRVHCLTDEFEYSSLVSLHVSFFKYPIGPWLPRFNCVASDVNNWQIDRVFPNLQSPSSQPHLPALRTATFSSFTLYSKRLQLPPKHCVSSPPPWRDSAAWNWRRHCCSTFGDSLSADLSVQPQQLNHNSTSITIPRASTSPSVDRLRRRW